MNIIGINLGHNSSVALSTDSKIIFAISEERLNRQKNYFGVPSQSLNYIYNNIIPKEDVDFYGIYHDSNHDWNLISSSGDPKDYNKYEIRKNRMINLFKSKMIQKLYNFYERKILNQDKIKEYYSQKLNVPRQKIALLNHHLCHAHSAVFSLDKRKPWLIFTNDGEGDKECAAVYLYDKDKIKKLTSIEKENSLGYMFYFITYYLGMKPNSHEFKVMGLEPYARKSTIEFKRAYNKLNNLFYFEGLDFRSKVPMIKDWLFNKWLNNNMAHERFDYVAAAAQKTLERVSIEWVLNWIKNQNVSNIALAGGVFMNVKLNQRLYNLDEVSDIYVVPSAGDETTVLGACNIINLNNNKGNLKPFEHLYLGNEIDDEDVKEFVETKLDTSRYRAIFYGEALERVVAECLSNGIIVGRFNGRLEFGARALGNRSILAHPKDKETVRKINELIKDRDFWMPFTPSILEEDAERYINNPRKMYSPYMSITFNSTEQGKSDFAAAIHPYDETMRIQMVSKLYNYSYYQLISEFKKRTGIGGVLNTSFNLHGEPNVGSLQDCIHTLDNSGITHLSLGRYLIEKK